MPRDDETDFASASLSEETAPPNGISPPMPEQSNIEDEDSLIHALVMRGREGNLHSSIMDLSEEEETDLVNRIIQDFDDSEAAIQEFKKNHTEFVEIWRGLVKEKNFPFPNAANVRVPLTSTFVEQWKARIFRIIFGGHRIVEFSSLDESIPRETLEEISDWFQYELEEIVCFEEAMQHVIHDILIDGLALPVASYQTHEKRLCSTRDFEIVEDSPISEQLHQALEVIFQDEDPTITNTGKGIFTVEYNLPNQERREGKVEFCIENEKLSAYIEKQEIVFSGVKVEKINLEDLAIVNSATRLEDLPFFGSRLFISPHDYVSGVKSGFYRDMGDEVTAQVIGHAEQKQGEVIEQKTTDLLDKAEGTQSKDISGVDLSRRWIEVYRWEGRWAIGMGAIESTSSVRSEDQEAAIENLEEQQNIVVWADPRTRKILRICKAEELNKDGERSPVKFDFIIQPERFLSVGLVEWLKNIQFELEGIHRQRLDSGLLSTVPFFFYVPAAGMQHTILTLEPGKGYPIKDPNAIVWPKTNFTPVWSFQEELNVRKYGQEQAGLGDPAVGSFLSKRTSATEFSQTAASADLRTSYIVSGIYRSLRKLLYRIFGLYQQFAEDGRVFQVTGIAGERIVKRLKRDRLNGKLILHLTANIQQLNEQLERDIAVNMLSIFLNELLIQMGIVRPDTIYSAVEKVVRASGYKGVPIHKPDMPPSSESPQVEHKRMLLGERVEPSPTEDFNMHMREHLALMSDPNFTKYFPTQEAQQLLLEHVQKTAQLQQTVMMLRQQQAVQAQGMQQNMASMGIRPGMAGGQQTGNQAEPASQEEGVPTANQGEY